MKILEKDEFVIKCDNEREFMKVQVKLFTNGYEWKSSGTELEDYNEEDVCIAVLDITDGKMVKGEESFFKIAMDDVEMFTAKELLQGKEKSASDGLIGILEEINDFLEEKLNKGSIRKEAKKASEATKEQLKKDKTLRNISHSAALALKDTLDMEAIETERLAFIFASVVVQYEKEKE